MEWWNIRRLFVVLGGGLLRSSSHGWETCCRNLVMGGNKLQQLHHLPSRTDINAQGCYCTSELSITGNSVTIGKPGGYCCGYGSGNMRWLESK